MKKINYLFTIVTACISASLPLSSRAEDLPNPSQARLYWPTTKWLHGSPPSTVDKAELENVTNRFFEGQHEKTGLLDTRALLVVYGGDIVVERYAPGFASESKFHSWSIAKSFTQALVGILVRQGKLSVDGPAPVAAWKTAGDPRGEITVRQLLQMTSGLKNSDSKSDFLPNPADPGSTLLPFEAQLLFGKGSLNTAKYAADVPLVNKPGEVFAYSTANTLILSGIVADAVGRGPAMLDFMRNELFTPLGMSSVVPEFDQAGTFIGGAHIYATAQDYARFGLLYLRGGYWEGRQILPKGWVSFSRESQPEHSGSGYAAHFWSNALQADNPARFSPFLPDGVYSANGVLGQYLVINPEKDLIIVRLGNMHATSYSELNDWIANLNALFPRISTGERHLLEQDNETSVH